MKNGYSVRRSRAHRRNRRRFYPEADGYIEKFIYRMPLGGWTAEWWIETFCHEQIHASAPEDGTLGLPEWMIDGILEWTGLTSRQLLKSEALKPKTWRPRLV